MLSPYFTSLVDGSRPSSTATTPRFLHQCRGTSSLFTSYFSVIPRSNCAVEFLTNHTHVRPDNLEYQYVQDLTAELWSCLLEPCLHASNWISNTCVTWIERSVLQSSMFHPLRRRAVRRKHGGIGEIFISSTRGRLGSTSVSCILALFVVLRSA